VFKKRGIVVTKQLMIAPRLLHSQKLLVTKGATLRLLLYGALRHNDKSLHNTLLSDSTIAPKLWNRGSCSEVKINSTLARL